LFRNKLCTILATSMIFSATTAFVLPPRALALSSQYTYETISDAALADMDYTIDILKDGKIIQTVSNDIYYQKYYEEPVTRGITRYSFERLDPKGWVRGHVLVVDLSDTNVRTDLLQNGSLSSKKTLSSMVKNSGALAGVNGDFFDIGKTNVPQGVVIDNNELIKSSQNYNQAIGLADNGLGFISRILFNGSLRNVSRDAEPVQLHGINEIKPQPDQTILYNSLWGQASRSSLIGSGVSFTEVVIKDNTVTEILENTLYPGALDANTIVLLGLGTASDQLKEQFAIGEQIEITYSTDQDFKNIQYALSGDVLVVENGKPVSHPSNPYTHPRTAAGFSRDRTKMYVAVIDGRYAGSRGFTYDELGIYMASIGAWNAINLDSGGSSELVARPVAETTPVVANRPSEGSERQIPNGIGFWSTAPQGSLAGFKLEPLENRVLQGFTRSITAKAYDEYINPLTDSFDPAWSADKADTGFFTAEGIFKGLNKGKTTVTASSSGKSGSTVIQVLGKPEKIYPSLRNIDFTSAKSAAFVVKGMDEAGYEALIEPRDITLQYDKSILEITSAANGRYTIKPLSDSFATTVTITAGGLQTAIGVTAGTDRKVINTFDNASQWSFVNLPAETKGSVSLTQAEGRGNVLKMEYDFTLADATRMADIKAEPGPIELPGRPVSVGVLVNGDHTNGEWLRMTLRDSAGQVFYRDLAKTIDWQGWKYVTTDIPSNAVHPVYLDRIYVVEQNVEKKYTGSILVDDLTLEYRKTVELPAEQPAREPILSSWDSLPSKASKFAVVSGMELRGNGGIFASIRNRQLLRKLKLEDVDFVIFNGGIVASDALDNYQFARDFIDDNLNLPYYAVPGVQDASGTSKLDNFTNTFGSSFQKVDMNDTRFILLNSSLGNLRVSNPDQWRTLLQWLKDSKTDKSINNLVVVNQVPLNTPSVLADKNFDSYEAKLLEELLTEVTEESDKRVTYISSGAKELTVKRHEGVAYIDTGYKNSADYSVFGINPNTNGNASIIVKFTP